MLIRGLTRLMQLGRPTAIQRVPQLRAASLSTQYSLTRLASAVGQSSALHPARRFSTLPDQACDEKTLTALAVAAELRHLQEEGTTTRETLGTRLVKHGGNAEKVCQELQAGLTCLRETSEGRQLAAIHDTFIPERFFFHDGDYFKTLVEIREALSLLAMPNAKKLTDLEVVSPFYLVELYKQRQCSAFPVSLEISHLTLLCYGLDAQFLFVSKVIKPKDLLARMRRPGESVDDIKVHLEHLAKISQSAEADWLIEAKVIQPGFLKEKFIANDLDYEKTRGELAQLASLAALPPARALVAAKVLRPAQLVFVLQRNGEDFNKAKTELANLAWVASSDFATKLLALKVIEPGDLARRFHWHKGIPGVLLEELFYLDKLNSQEAASKLIIQGVIPPRYLAEVLHAHNGNYDRAVTALAGLEKLCAAPEVQALPLAAKQRLAQGFRANNWDVEATRKQIGLLPTNKPLAQSSRFICQSVEIRAAGIQIGRERSEAPQPGKP